MSCFVCKKNFSDEGMLYCSACQYTRISERTNQLRSAAQQLVRAREALLPARAGARGSADQPQSTRPDAAWLPSIDVYRAQKSVEIQKMDLELLRSELIEVNRSVETTKQRIGRKQIALSKAVQDHEDSEAARNSADYPKSVAVTLSQVRQKLEERAARSRRDLIRSLLSFFPLNPVSETEHQLVNVVLPNDSLLFVRCSNASLCPNIVDGDQVAAGLGYVVQLLLIAERYLAIRLPHPVKFMGSQSLIRERADPLTPTFVLCPSAEQSDAGAAQLPATQLQPGSSDARRFFRPSMTPSAGISTGGSNSSLPSLMSSDRRPSKHDESDSVNQAVNAADAADNGDQDSWDDDDDADIQSVQWYARAYNENPQFVSGLRLLNENVTWLLGVHGIEIARDTKFHLLPNLLRLFRSPKLGSVNY